RVPVRPAGPVHVREWGLGALPRRVERLDVLGGERRDARERALAHPHEHGPALRLGDGDRLLAHVSPSPASGSASGRGAMRSSVWSSGGMRFLATSQTMSRSMWS